MPFDSVEKTGVLADLAALVTRVTAIEPTDALQLALEDAQETIVAQNGQITTARAAVTQAQTALTAAAEALNPTP